MKKFILMTAGLLIAVSSLAQDAVPKSFSDDPFNHPMFRYAAVFTLLFFALILTIVVAIYVMKIGKLINAQIEKEKAEKLGAAYVPAAGWWSRFMEKMNASVPVDQEKDIEMDHSYDGIKELDNHLPPWWKWLFYGSIGWAALYLVIFHFSNSLPLSQEEYQNEMAFANEQARIRQARQPKEAIDETKLEFNNDPTIIERGKNVFASNPCTSCHRADGGGNTIGPNLTDEYWLHGGDAKSVFHTIQNGVIDKGMPAWGKALTPQDVRDVTFYILSLQGSKPANAKAPQGELFKPKEVSAKADSTKAQASL